ncbi:MAG: hypothetical protein K7J46_20350, partial [Bryobacter sp.]|nr:hypothetical protein [Bryobacter sp. CoA8 C33]
GTLCEKAASSSPSANRRLDQQTRGETRQQYSVNFFADCLKVVDTRRKWTISEAREIFRSFGLEGPIWDLPAVDRGFRTRDD